MIHEQSEAQMIFWQKHTVCTSSMFGAYIENGCELYASSVMLFQCNMQPTKRRGWFYGPGVMCTHVAKLRCDNVWNIACMKAMWTATVMLTVEFLIETACPFGCHIMTKFVLNFRRQFSKSNHSCHTVPTITCRRKQLTRKQAKVRLNFRHFANAIFQFKNLILTLKYVESWMMIIRHSGIQHKFIKWKHL